MKIVVTHTSPDMDAITSVWYIQRFFPGWENAEVRFVPAGSRLGNLTEDQALKITDPIESINGNEVIQVDTGLGPLDHHQTSDKNVCGASLSWDYVKKNLPKEAMSKEKLEALVNEHIEEPFLGMGTSRVHVLRLNIDLDQMK